MGEIASDNQCLRHCYRGNNFSGVLWSAWEFDSGDRGIRCDLLRFDSADGKWSYKPLDESMEPYYYSCPLGYLDLVPDNSKFARPEWRAKVRQYHDPKNAFRGR